MLIKNRKHKKVTSDAPSTKSGYTIIEVMLVLGISGMMMVGLFVGTYTAVSRQRYNDSLRGFAEYLRGIYSEVISPESYSTTNIGTSNNTATDATGAAILGKMLVFGLNGDTQTVSSATLVGSTEINRPNTEDFISEMLNEGTKLGLFCGVDQDHSSVQTYNTLWEAELVQANGQPSLPAPPAVYDQPLVGTLIIARTPSSSRVHTIFAKDVTYDLSDCRSANTRFQTDLRESRTMGTQMFTINQPVGICVKSDNTNSPREIRIAADGSNTSAVWMRDADPEDGDYTCREP